MPTSSVTATGTLSKVNPRPANALPATVAASLRRAADTHEREQERARDKLRAAVVAALEHGSVRQVAAAAGLSPTTVQAWSKGNNR